MSKQKKIAVIGSINEDMSVIAERIPTKGETVYGDHVTYHPGGKGANQAVAMVRLGAQVEMFGCVGNDASGERMLENLKKNGIVTDHIKVLDDVHTGLAVITIGDHDNTIVIVSGANERVDKNYVDEIKEILKNYDMVVLQHEIPLDTVHYVVEFCSEHKIPVTLNPAPAAKIPMEIVEKVTYLTPNEHEAKLIFGDKFSTEELLRKYPEKLFITQGEKGVCTCLKTGEVLTVPARKSSVVDTTGAGDTLNGAFAVRIAYGDCMKKALKYANTAAGLSVEKLGAQEGMPIAADVENEIKE
ncbi:ribokinase [Anaerostipes sp.]|uniref:ribokinase n=1 Tax=Anaerostipes sp. TaxID=1872530 RepID=UPI003FF1557D